jgi:ATP-dependent Clp protease ATP-binding subunit ClpA
MFSNTTYAIIIVIAIGLGVLYRKAMGALVKKSKGAILYTQDISLLAETGKLDPMVGRELEVERAVHILLRRTKNNPLLIGQPGVGKTSIVEGLATRIFKGSVPSGLKNKRVLSLDLVALLSDTKLRGDLESRIQHLLRSLESQGERVILFIDEIHQIQQAGGTEGAINIADALKPVLAKGILQVIGATTWDEYNKYMRLDQALDRRFQLVLVDEPTPEVALLMLQHLRPVYEKHHGVKITDLALEAAVKMSDEKIDHRYLPDKAIDLIDEAAAKVSIACEYKHVLPLGVVHAAATVCADLVDVKDIQEVIDQWIIHGKQDQKRDPRLQG